MTFVLPEEGPSLDRNVVVNKLCFLMLWRIFIKLNTRYCVLLSLPTLSHLEAVVEKKLGIAII